MLLQRESRAVEPAGDLFRGNSEPAMGMFTAQRFELVRREIDDHHATFRLHNAPCLEQGTTGIIKIVQHLVYDD